MNTFLQCKNPNEIWIKDNCQPITLNYGAGDSRVEYLVSTNLYSLIRV